MKTSTYIGLLLLGCLLPTLSRGQLGPNIPAQPPTEADKAVNTFLQGSIDLVRQNFSGPSYQGAKPTIGDVFVFNVALQVHNQALINSMLKYYNTQTHGYRRGRIRPADPTTLLATLTDQPGPLTPPDKAPFLSHLSLLYGVQLIGKGGKEKDGYETSTVRMTYLEPTGYVLYNHDLSGNRGKLFGGIGLYLAYGLWGKSTYEEPGFGTQSTPAFGKNVGFKRFDAGLGFTAGYQMPQGLRLSLAYELGLVNIDPGAGDDKTRNRALSLNVAYPLKKLASLVHKK